MLGTRLDSGQRRPEYFRNRRRRRRLVPFYAAIKTVLPSATAATTSPTTQESETDETKKTKRANGVDTVEQEICAILTGRSNWILHRNLTYLICCLRDGIIKIARDLFIKHTHNTSVSGVKSSWTTLSADFPCVTCGVSTIGLEMPT